jgi:hypothetical protein
MSLFQGSYDRSGSATGGPLDRCGRSDGNRRSPRQNGTKHRHAYDDRKGAHHCREPHGENLLTLNAPDAIGAANQPYTNHRILSHDSGIAYTRTFFVEMDYGYRRRVVNQKLVRSKNRVFSWRYFRPVAGSSRICSVKMHSASTPDAPSG